MIEVAPGLWVGNEKDYAAIEHELGWAICHACKEPFHREAVGYVSHGAPKQHPEYLFAIRDGGKRLCMNLVDADDIRYIPAELIKRGLHFIDDQLLNKRKVLVHCNQGGSRAPSLALAYLRAKRQMPFDFKAAEVNFLRKYPEYSPRNGIRSFVEANWDNFPKEF